MAHNGRKGLAQKTTVGCEVKFYGIPVGKVEDEISRLDGSGEYKNFFQKIRLCPQKARELRSKYAYRWCYWVIGKGEVVRFGQFALVMQPIQLRHILTEARKKGWQI
ncbi:MAG TPA: hypothetical protein VEK84_10525 [Terriglobales bacterium]|nr:hypothetical protein [Terriglobales bacterium]